MSLTENGEKKMKRVSQLVSTGLIVLATITLPMMRAIAQEDHVVTDTNLSQKLQNAKSAADHEMIAEYYERRRLTTLKRRNSTVQSQTSTINPRCKLTVTASQMLTRTLQIRIRPWLQHIGTWRNSPAAKLDNE
jgi:hypothetical protein